MKTIIILCAITLTSLCSPLLKAAPGGKPNIIIIFIDDMGYGDLACYGSPHNRTPHLDKMAAEGMKFTDFYSACSVCSPSRAALMTGCYPQRINLHEDENGKCVLFPGSTKGLSPDEITIAEILKKQGYHTACIGKWHLGDHPDFLPTKQGFDYYYGIPYSNDMNRPEIPLPLLRDETVIEAPVNQDTITRRYTEEAIKFIRQNKDTPFFVYLPHAMVHLPLFAGKDFKGKSANGIYGDAVEEIDWSTGEIIRTLQELSIDNNTLIVFTSDNGSTGRNGGNNLPLSGHKGQTQEGGMRIPCLMRYPGVIPAGRICSEISGTIDLMPTVAALTGAEIPRDRIIDGKNILPLMTAQPGAKSPHEAYFYYQMDQLQCIRSGKWKLHLPLDSKKKNWGKPEKDIPIKLYDLEQDIHEDRNLASQHPEIAEKLIKLGNAITADIGDAGKPGKNQRPAGMVEQAHPQLMP